MQGCIAECDVGRQIERKWDKYLGENAQEIGWDVTVGPTMRQVRNGLGNYFDLLKEVSYSPVMANYLSYRDSKSYDASGYFPDENYAREVTVTGLEPAIPPTHGATLIRGANVLAPRCK